MKWRQVLPGTHLLAVRRGEKQVGPGWENLHWEACSWSCSHGTAVLCVGPQCFLFLFCVIQVLPELVRGDWWNLNNLQEVFFLTCF